MAHAIGKVAPWTTNESAIIYTFFFFSVVYVGSTIGFAYSVSIEGLLITRTVQALGSSLSVVSGLALLAATFRY